MKVMLNQQENTKDFATKQSFILKQNDTREFKCILELFYHDTEEVQPANNQDQKKDLKKKSCASYSF